MKKVIFGMLMLLTINAYAVEKGEAICIKAYLANYSSSNFNLSKKACEKVTEGQALCIEAYLSNYSSSNFDLAKAACN
ncbi:MAG: hypothetical protein KA715_03140 [Xanthomonadaceae bacterium]|nr:hypothetical protein [Xanthomonadaceae bacterium]